MDCGGLTYAFDLLTLLPDEPDMISSLSVDAANSTVGIVIDKTLVRAGVNATFSLSGLLTDYPDLSHT